ncbi:hypothetical protein C8A00DRAFT_44661 [Chaetomidium leptoderma]|uniref:Uncharacterized protein n=1 Tax=Chaetomidium leptoderma TaxID=669021 RepID=A0AAN6VJ66_9PEZI|nr:hypothetical protein C8A00DRAFT_44661 [Chaetomidium leptoderma]
MAEQSTRPVLMSKIRVPYGRCDYKRFDNIASSHMRAGRGSIGKVEVDCRFLFTKSHWGVVGENKNPAGILYLDLDLRQPPDCKLESATVTVTLEEEDGEEDRIEHLSGCPVKFTDHYGPKSLRGEQSYEQTRKVKRRTPEVQLLGYGAGGLGVDKEKMVQTASRWKFSGHICSSKGNLWYNKLQWDLQENPLERQPTHNNLIHTAFALEHNATRFYMTVHVSGKLARFSDKLISRFKFRSKEEKNEEIVTKIEWRDGYSSSLRLDPIAQDLHPAMQHQNMSQVPIELPSALPAKFRPETTNLASSATYHQPGITPWSAPGLPANVVAEPLMINDPAEHLQTPPTLDDLRLVSGITPRPPSPSHSTATPEQPELDDVSESWGSETLVNSAATTPVDEESTTERITDTWEDNSGKATEEPDPKSQGAGAWLSVTAMLLFCFMKIVSGIKEESANGSL